MTFLKTERDQLEDVALDSQMVVLTSVTVSSGLDALMVRYAARDAIARACRSALETLGGMAFIGSGEGSYLASAAAGLPFHPPSRGRMAEQLCAALDGERLRIN